jgi:hypothetical protein
MTIATNKTSKAWNLAPSYPAKPLTVLKVKLETCWSVEDCMETKTNHTNATLMKLHVLFCHAVQRCQLLRVFNESMNE